MAVSNKPASPNTFEFRAWNPPKSPGLVGPFAKNDRLANIERLSVAAFGKGPEDVAIDKDGSIYAGLDTGAIVRFPKGSSNAELFVSGLGRPTGIEFAPDGRLIVCDAIKGLLAVDKAGRVEVLATEAGDRPIVFPNNLAIQKDGTIYFTDSSRRFAQKDHLGEILAHDDGGRLLRYHPKSGETSVVKDGLYFPNGLAFSKDEDFLLLAEMNKYRLLRLWLKGPQAGTMEPFAENLPGLPDNISPDEKGNFWIGMSGLRSGVLDRSLPHPWMRKLLSKIPEGMLPKPPRHAFVLAFDPEGNVIENLQDPKGGFAYTTSAVPHGDDLFVASLHEDAIGKVKLK